MTNEDNYVHSKENYGSAIATSSSNVNKLIAFVTFIVVGSLLYFLLPIENYATKRLITFVSSAFVFFVVVNGVYVVANWERVIVLRLGKYLKTTEEGMNFKIPIVDQIFYRDTRDRSFDLVPQKILTKDTVPVKVNAVIFYKIVDAKKSVINATNWIEMTTERAKAELRETISKKSLDDILEKREEIASEIRKELDEATDPWGIKVSEVKVKDIILPVDMERAMAQESEATREKRARIIKAEAEKKAAEIMVGAAKDIARNPAILELRRLQTISEIGAENNSTTVIMLPEELIRMVKK